MWCQRCSRPGALYDRLTSDYLPGSDEQRKEAL
jgi:hypothetical protein